MLAYAIIVNEETKQVQVGTGTDVSFYQSIGMTEMDVEQGYNGSWYVQGYAPAKPQSEKEQEVRQVRANYFEQYVDWYQSKPLLWNEMSELEKQYIAEYRIYLMDYTDQENWWEKNPDDYQTWLVAHHPVTE